MGLFVGGCYCNRYIVQKVVFCIRVCWCLSWFGGNVVLGGVLCRGVLVFLVGVYGCCLVRRYLAVKFGRNQVYFCSQCAKKPPVQLLLKTLYIVGFNHPPPLYIVCLTVCKTNMYLFDFWVQGWYSIDKARATAHRLTVIALRLSYSTLRCNLIPQHYN